MVVKIFIMHFLIIIFLKIEKFVTYGLKSIYSPEGELAIAQAVIYLALAPKSNAAYAAFKNAMNAARQTGSNPPPKHILNAPTKMMKEQGYGSGYAYDHDAEDGFSGQNYFPDGMARGFITCRQSVATNAS